MTKLFNCTCGEVATGENDDELVASVNRHVEKVHPELVGTISRAQVVDGAYESSGTSGTQH